MKNVQTANEGAVGVEVNRRVFALSYGLAVHVLFLLAVLLMGTSFHGAFPLAIGTLSGPSRFFANLALLIQFPLIHSFLLSNRGRKLLAKPFGGDRGRTLSTTTYAATASLQLIVALLFWSPSHVVWFRPEGALWWVWSAVYGASWLLLMKAMLDAGLGVQVGYQGWVALFLGKKPKFSGFSTKGMCGACRHPIYFTFALILWLGPVWTPDHLFVALVWTLYCAVGPLLKERRYLQFYGDKYNEFRSRTPYWFPALPRISGRLTKLTADVAEG